MIVVLKMVVDFVRAGGVLGIVAILVWGIVVLKGLGNMSSYVFQSIKSSALVSDRIGVNAISIVDEIREVEKLKVLRVCDAGIEEILNGPLTNANCVGIAFQYAGFVDLIVDLKKTDINIEPNGQCTVRFKEGITTTSVKPLRRPESKEKIEGGMCVIEPLTIFGVTNRTMFSESVIKSEQAKLLRKRGMYQAEAVKRTALSSANLTRAQRRAETIVSDMLLPIIQDGQNVRFEWPADRERN